MKSWRSSPCYSSFQVSSFDSPVSSSRFSVGSYTLSLSRLIKQGKESNELLYFYAKEILIGLITALLCDLSVLLAVLTYEEPATLDEEKLVRMDI